MNHTELKLLLEGGAVGHLMHLYDNRDLTFGEIKKLLTAASEGKLQKVSEKFDGMNLVFSWSVEHNDLRVARAGGDIKRGGMDAAGIAAKFANRGNVGDAFTSAFTVLKQALSALSENEKIKIFGTNANFWYSIEIIYPQNTNVINYDSNNVIFHGWPIFQIKEDGSVINNDDHPGVDILSSRIDSMQKAVAARNWKVKGPAVIQLQKMSNGAILDKTLSAISTAQSKAGLDDDASMGDYLRSMLEEELVDLELPSNAASALVGRALGDPGTPNINAIKKMARGQEEVVVAFAKAVPAIMGKVIRPIELAIHEFAIEVLRGVQSTLVSDNEKEVARLRQEVAAAIKSISASGDEAAMSTIQRHMEKLQSLENIASSTEGVVFIYKGNAYKFTGAFAPANQILGLFKYGKVKSSVQSTDEAKLQTVINKLIKG